MLWLSDILCREWSPVGVANKIRMLPELAPTLSPPANTDVWHLSVATWDRTQIIKVPMCQELAHTLSPPRSEHINDLRGELMAVFCVNKLRLITKHSQYLRYVQLVALSTEQVISHWITPPTYMYVIGYKQYMVYIEVFVFCWVFWRVLLYFRLTDT